MRFIRPLLTAALILLGSHAATAQEIPRIVTANYALQYFAERLARDVAEVVFPVPADVDPSFWRPSIADISMIQSSDLIVLNGAGFATWVDRVSLPRAKVVNTTAAIEDQFIVTESITHAHGQGDTHSHEGLASYTWLDPMLAIAQSEAIAAALIRRKIAPAENIEARLNDLRNDLEALDKMARNSLAKAQDIPLIATHPRYQYFARRYGLSIASLEWEAGAMPTADERADLEEMVKDTGAQIILWEAAPPQGAIEAIVSRNLESVTFPPFARSERTTDFLSAFSSAVKAVSDAAGLIEGE